MKISNNEYFNLLKTWADSLISLQVTDSKHKEFYGGIMCPACKLMHGRIGDTMYPLVYLYSVTGDKKYYNAAKLSFTWVINNMQKNKGVFINDANSTWYGITSFFNIQLGELLYELKEFIDPEDYKHWYKTYEDTCEFLYSDKFPPKNAVVNYIVATATSMAIAWKLTGKEQYYEKAKKFAKIVLKHFTDEGFLFGEGKIPTLTSTPKGCYAVDIGYNVEESLPNLAIYLKYIDNDDDIKTIVLKSLKAHLDFLLPDGAWDNSWGARTAKWTYWGSRTSDGSQIAYEYFADYDDAFFEAAHRNFELYKKCTVNGLLAGGLHHNEMNEPVCIHHSFCHLKGIICMAKTVHKRTAGIKLPREVFDGIKQYKTMDVSVAKRGEWTATFSCDDYAIKVPEDTPSGGAVTLLYHNKTGVILTGGQNEYELVEPNNMQIPKHYDNVCQLTRIETEKDGERYKNTFDTTAKTEISDDGKTITYKVQGALKNFKHEEISTCSIIYTLTEESFKISASADCENAKLIIPVVTVPGENIKTDKNTVTIQKENAVVEIEGSKNIDRDLSKDKRIFNCNGGFATAHFTVDINKKETITLTLKVK